MSSMGRLLLGLLAGAAVVAGLGVHVVRVRGAIRENSGRQQQSAYIGSDRCRKCHQAHYESWHRTYHRTMTQEASAASVLGDFSGRELSYMGVTARMERAADGGFLMRFAAGEQRWEARVERTVGSHRYQQYLARDEDLYFRLPIAWDVSEGRFIHMNGAFLTPDPPHQPGQPVASANYHRHVTRWNDNCIFCHNVAPNPGSDGVGGFASEVAELGVACEACHGPGGAHARANRDPLRRYVLHFGLGHDPDIAAPGRMSAARSADVCGRCHGQRLSPDIARVQREGDRFVPGEDLSRYSRPLFRDTALGGDPRAFAARFWADGTPRLTAYEYQGLLLSPCRRHPRFDCGSCHSMHRGPVAGQMRPELALTGNAEAANRLCTQCHQKYTDSRTAAGHSGHDEHGPGNRCVACHMPRVVYGLLRTHDSHRILVPRAASPGQPPDACALCHVERDGQALAAMRRRLEFPAPDQPAGAPLVDVLLQGDPVERAVAAAALGTAGADLASDSLPHRLALLLDTLVAEDYPAVREIARRSLSRLLQRQAPGASAALDGYLATAERSMRQQVAGQVALRLPEGLAAPLDPDRVQRLRARAVALAIEIGE